MKTRFISLLAFLAIAAGKGLVVCTDAAETGLELRVSSDFPGGSARVLSIDATNNSIRIMPAGDPKHGWPCWWFFRLDGAGTNRPVVLEVDSSPAPVATGNAGRKARLDANWSLPAQAAFSLDGTNWDHTEKGMRQGNHCVYQINTSRSTLWLAWGPPFTIKDANQMIQETCSFLPNARSFVLAHTREGRPVPGVRISEPGTTGSPRFGIWIQARQHAWESGSSWVARGFLEWLASNDPAAKSLRDKADITVIPIMDVDSVELGQGGKQQIPHDQNRDWDRRPYFPEVRADMDQLSGLAKDDRLDLFLDLHDPGAHDHSTFFYLPSVPLMSPQRSANATNFFDSASAQLTGPIPYTGKIVQGQTYNPDEVEDDRTVDNWVASQSQPHVVSLTMEVPWNIPGSTQSGYRKVGEQLGRCIDSYLQPSIRSGSGTGAH